MTDEQAPRASAGTEVESNERLLALNEVQAWLNTKIADESKGKTANQSEEDIRWGCIMAYKSARHHVQQLIDETNRIQGKVL